MTSNLRKALAVVGKDKNLSAADRAHLLRWEDKRWIEDPVWETLYTAVKNDGRSPVAWTYSTIIRAALEARKHAESLRGGFDPGFREQQEQHQRMLRLASHAAELAEYYAWAENYSGIAVFFQRFVMPVNDLKDFHEKEAELLRRRAGKVPRPAVRPRRQDRTKDRNGLRALHTFIDFMAGTIPDQLFVKADRTLLAGLSEIAFPGHDVDAEDVRKVLRPSSAKKGSDLRQLAPQKS